ncbi:YccV-like-domain-containing protein [Pluteus cervinus]|uniref:YccV-like-domain-containing protein n=1 Tax=Pluteus cervinus TaxID=181527 RepID=A0ACD3BH63_9AGAR|nr:YccV-like-domain-containing protein [Pluteus cervinus]
MTGITRHFPLDIIVSVLFQVPPVYEDGGDGAGTLLNCHRLNRLWREAASLSSLWEAHYKARYYHCDSVEEAQRWDEAAGTWKIMYGKRRSLDQQALSLLDHISNKRADRYPRAKLLVDMSFDVWDVLERLRDRPVDIFHEHADDAKYQTITQRYWAQSILQAIGRGYAVKVWSEYSQPPESSFSPPSFDTAMTVLSCFFGKSPVRIEVQLDSLADECKQSLLAKGLTFDVLDSKYDLEDLTRGTCQFMSSKGFGLAEPHNFLKVLNQFPHAYLSTNKETIPISLVHVFVAISRRLGIQASPIDFPAKVLVHVARPNSDVDLFLDVCRRDSPIINVTTEIHSTYERQLGIPAQEAVRYINPVGGAKMILRVARNILSASREGPDFSYGVSHCALQASLCIHLLLTNERQLASNILANVEILPLDCATYLPSVLAPALPMASEDLIRRTCESILTGEAESGVVIRRPDHKVTYFVGALFVHVRYGYAGCVLDWDIACSASEDWMMQMKVDALPRGRNQPFYHCVAADGSQRYVAEENIRLAKPTREIIQTLLELVPSLAMSFKAADLRNEDLGGRGRLLLSPEALLLHPDDDLVGQQWVETGELAC